MSKAIERFWTKVVKGTSGECWIWTGGHSTNGYGTFYDGTRNTSPHRYSYLTFIGDIPMGLELDHTCQVKGCVNPGHLEAVTHRENLLRAKGPAGDNARKTHCKRGHEYTQANTYIYVEPKGYPHRMCRECNRINVKFYRQRAKEVN